MIRKNSSTALVPFAVSKRRSTQKRLSPIYHLHYGVPLRAKRLGDRYRERVCGHGPALEEPQSGKATVPSKARTRQPRRRAVANASLVATTTMMMMLLLLFFFLTILTILTSVILVVLIRITAGLAVF